MVIWKIALAAVGVAALGAAAFLYVAFGAFLPWREDAEFARLAHIAQVGSGQTVAEIGAGGGRFAVALAQRVGPGGRVYATELSPARLAELRGHASRVANLTVVEATATETRLPDRCCHLVLMRTVYHHIADPQRFVSAVRRALVPGGRLVIIDFEPGALWFHGGPAGGAADRTPGHGVSQAVAAQEFSAAGFVVEHQVRAWSGPLWMTVLRRDDAPAGRLPPEL